MTPKLMIAVTIFIQFVLIPLMLLGWLVVVPISSRGIWVIRAVAIGMTLLSLDRLMNSSYLTVWLRYPVWGLFIVVLIFSGINVLTTSVEIWSDDSAWISMLVSILLILSNTYLFVNRQQGLQIPTSPVDLHFPLQNGRFLVVHGGGQPLINGHMKVSKPELYAWRGQM